mmetsp:Transcript_88375/g.153082  ORF Transcript_88375/g.153082 Transcript_88375/m.153082 type:complete len:197 (-) Transcript_88375:50-640(-)
MEDYSDDAILTEMDASQISTVAFHQCIDPFWSKKTGMSRIVQRVKFLEKQKKQGLSEQQMKEHDRCHCSGGSLNTSAQLEWLMSVKSKSDEVRAETFDAMAGHILSTLSYPNIAGHVAGFADGDCSDRERASLDEDSAPDGHHVRGCRYIERKVMIGEGRPGFIFDLDAEISTPRGSQMDGNAWDLDAQSLVQDGF